MILNFKFGRHIPLSPLSHSIKKKLADAWGSRKALLVEYSGTFHQMSGDKAVSTKNGSHSIDVSRKPVPQQAFLDSTNPVTTQIYEKLNNHYAMSYVFHSSKKNKV